MIFKTHGFSINTCVKSFSLSMNTWVSPLSFNEHFWFYVHLVFNGFSHKICWGQIPPANFYLKKIVFKIGAPFYFMYSNIIRVFIILLQVCL